VRHANTMILSLVLCACLSGFSRAQDEEAAKNPVVFWELACHDSEKSVEFFEKVFEWKTEMIPNTIIHGIETKQQDGGIDGGIFTLQKAKLPFLTIFIQVEDIEAKAKLIAESGGLIVIEPNEINPGTMICLFNDPSGVTFAMIEQKPAEE
jgi:predicted enzyme related to lactoylglutathione lyase